VISESDRRAVFQLIVQGLLIAALLTVLLLAAAQILNLLVLAFGSAVVAILIRAAADPLARRTGIADHWAAILVMLVLVALVGLGAWLFNRQMAGHVQQISEMLPSGWKSLKQQISQLPGGPEFLKSLQEGNSGNVFAGIARAVGTFATAIADFFLILFGAAFIALNPDIYRRGFLALVPERHRSLTGQALTDSEQALRQWMLGQLIAAVVVGILITIGLSLIGLPGAAVLGLIAGMFEIVPYAGPILGSIPALLVALAQSPQTALWTAIVFLVVEQIEGNLISPVVQKRTVHLPAALTLFGVVAAGLLLVPVGFVFAAPLLVVVFVLTKRLYVGAALDNSGSP